MINRRRVRENAETPNHLKRPPRNGGRFCVSGTSVVDAAPGARTSTSALGSRTSTSASCWSLGCFSLAQIVCLRIRNGDEDVAKPGADGLSALRFFSSCITIS